MKKRLFAVLFALVLRLYKEKIMKKERRRS